MFPRVLHIGFNPIGSPTNTGLTLASMFGGWPREQLMELYLPSRQLPGINPRQMMAPPRVAPLDAAIRRFLGSRIPAPVPDGMNNSIRGRSDALPFRYRLRAAATTLNEIGPVTARGPWLGPIDDFGPMVLHSLLGGVRVTKLVAALAKRLDVPVVPHFMDDWLSTMFADGKLLGLPRAQVERSVRAVLRQAPLCITIGEDMQREFEERLGIPCHVVGNSVSFADFDIPRETVRGPSRVFTYIGGLHLGRDLALAEVAKALARRASGAALELRVHAPASDDGRLRGLEQAFPSVVRSGGTIAPEDVARTLVASDVVLFVESARPEILDFTRLSVSTKVPEYLAARRPVLAIGPAVQSSIRALRLGPATSWADGADAADVDAAVGQSLSAADLPVPPVSKRLRELFDRERTQERLRVALAEAAGA